MSFLSKLLFGTGDYIEERTGKEVFTSKDWDDNGGWYDYLGCENESWEENIPNGRNRKHVRYRVHIRDDQGRRRSVVMKRDPREHLREKK